jgi:hypothetical protein
MASIRQFIEAWQVSESVVEVAGRTGLSKKNVARQFLWFRCLGVRLKPYRELGVSLESRARHQVRKAWRRPCRN